jgi:hypothetical protein
MSISRYIVAAVVRCSCASDRLSMELAEAEVAVGDERAHAELAGERQRFAVVGFSVLSSAGRHDVTCEEEGGVSLPRAPSRRLSVSASGAWLAASSWRPTER